MAVCHNITVTTGWQLRTSGPVSVVAICQRSAMIRRTAWNGKFHEILLNGIIKQQFQQQVPSYHQRNFFKNEENGPSHQSSVGKH